MLAQALTSVSCYFSPMVWLGESTELQLLCWLRKGRQDKSSTPGCRHAGLCDVGKKMLVMLENIHKEARSESQVNGKVRNWNKAGNSYKRSSCISACFCSTRRAGWIELQWANDIEIKVSLHTLKCHLRKGTASELPTMLWKAQRRRACTATSAPALGQQMSPAANPAGQNKYKVSSRKKENDCISLNVSVAAKWTRWATSFLWEQLRMS